MVEIKLLQRISELETIIEESRVLKNSAANERQISQFEIEIVMDIYEQIVERESLIDFYREEISPKAKFTDYSDKKRKIRNMLIAHFLGYLGHPNSRDFMDEAKP